MCRFVILLLVVVSFQQVAQGVIPSSNSDPTTHKAPCTKPCASGFSPVMRAGGVIECYNIITQRTYWENARTICNGLGGWLTWITSEEQDIAIDDFLEQHKGTINQYCAEGLYHGLQRSIPTSCASQDFFWKGACGENELATFFKWHENTLPPCSANTESCGVIQNTDGYPWSTRNCLNSLCYLCQSHAFSQN